MALRPDSFCDWSVKNHMEEFAQEDTHKSMRFWYDQAVDEQKAEFREYKKRLKALESSQISRIIKLDALRKRLIALDACIPEPEPWPPMEGSFDWRLYEKLGRPAERMPFMDMYLAVAEKVWNEID